MNLLLGLIYLVALFFVVLFVVRLVVPERTVIVMEEQPVVVGWWPWSISSYNAWPFWGGWWTGGQSGGYSVRAHPHPPHPLPHPSHPPRAPSSHGPHSSGISRPWGGGGGAHHRGH